MKKQWQVRRTYVDRFDGQRRWDYTYQSLLRWTMEQTMNQPPANLPSQENDHENRPVCPSINQSPDAKPEY
jgi:hypothetical protein